MYLGDNLIIRQAIISDSGVYTCYAETFGSGVRVAEVPAKVTVEPQQVVEEGRVTLYFILH